MTSRSPIKIALVAEEAAGVKTLRMLLGRPIELVAVLTSGGNTAGVSVDALARKSGCEVWPAQAVRDAELGEQFARAGVDLVLNVHSLYLIHPAVLRAPTIGCFNLHPGPLPQYAGLNAPSWAVYRGEQRHAVTLHWMQPGIDTGAVAYESTFDLGPHDTGFTVSAACVRYGLPLMERLLDDACADQARIPRVPQNLAKRRVYTRRAVPHEGRLRWECSAEEIVRFVRACDFYPLTSPWGSPWAYAGSQRFGVVRARVGDELATHAAPGTVLRVDGADAWVASADRAVVLQKVLINRRLVAASEVVSSAGARLE
jgi:methionyl-tRNA formyltransferase